jgi:hypothetical protein
VCARSELSKIRARAVQRVATFAFNSLRKSADVSLYFVTVVNWTVATFHIPCCFTQTLVIMVGLSSTVV